MEKLNKTLVIIPNYNHLDLLKKCIVNILKSDIEDFSVLIVDNGSDDEVISYINEICALKENFHKIFLSDNMGFATAVNKGLEYSIDKNYKYSILLNNDAYVESDFIKRLTRAIDFRKNIFAISSLMISYTNNDLIDDFGDNLNIFGFAFQNKHANKVSVIEKDEKVFSACGGASIFDNEKLKKVGLIDDKFFAYLEDVDLSYRARLLGYNIETCMEAKCYHVGSATSGSKYNDFKVKLSARNNIYMIYKNMPIIQIIINFIPLLIGILVKQTYFIKKGFGKAYFDGIREGIISAKTLDRSHLKKVFFLRYFVIEFYLIINFFKYLIDYGNRRLGLR